MKLQLALDLPSLDRSLALVERVGELFEILEVGTPLIYAEGMRAVRELRPRFAGLLLADLKIMDAGELEARIALEAGADLVTVLAAAHLETIARVAEAARRAGREAMADLIGLEEPVSRLAILSRAGIDLVCCHTAFDRQGSGENPTATVEALRRAAPSLRIAVAGGIDPARLTELLPFSPEIVVVGGYLTNAAEPRAAAEALRAVAASSSTA